ncbi:hypothetical protein V6N13_114221 [Hibiscus sabdariffa]
MTSAPSLDVSCRKRASTYGGDEFSGKGDGEMAVVLSNAQWGLVFRLLRDGGEVKGNGSPVRAVACMGLPMGVVCCWEVCSMMEDMLKC